MQNGIIEAAPQNPQQGSVKSTYIYDYMGRRARKTLYTYSSGSWQKQKDISFIFDGWNMVKESEKTSDSSPEVPVYYVWGLDLSQSMQGAGGVGGLIASVKSGNEYFYTYDANGNVGQMVKSSDGVIAARYEYDPFGKTIFSEGPMASENPYRFSSKYQDDETGLYYYGFRFYDVDLGRWINRDPIGENGGHNVNNFVYNDSINIIDSHGLALYAFDGTGNNKFYGQNNYTHVARLHALYRGHNYYYAGIGSLFNGYGTDALLGAMGVGVDSRVDGAFTDFEKEWKNKTDKEVDIIGFSRGATLARLFSKKIYAVYGDCVKIRFVGLFDTVASFHGVNEEYNAPNALNLPKTVQYAYHIIARDEHRSLFPVTKLNKFDIPNNGDWQEDTLPGSHSDIGGGYGENNNQLAYDSLVKMHSYAVGTAKVPFSPLNVTADDFVKSDKPNEPLDQELPDVPHKWFNDSVDRNVPKSPGVREPFIPMKPLTPDQLKMY